MRAFLRDVGFGLRAIRRAPGSALLATATMALGIALVTVQAAPVQRLLFQPLPFDPTGRLVDIRWSGPEPHARAARPRPPEARALARFQTSFQIVTGFAIDQIGHGVRLADGRWIQEVGLAVLPGFLEATGVPIARGRPLSAQDHGPGAAPVLVASHGMWQRLGGRPDLVGQTITFDRQPRTIVGVAGPHPGIDGEAFWAPAAVDPGAPREAAPPLHLLAVLAPGVTLARANQDVARLALPDMADLPRELLAELGRLEVVGARDGLVRGEILDFYQLMLAVGLLVLLCACANVTNLLLARAAGRGHELAVRASLGASRAVLVRQLIAEAVPLGLAAAALGLALSAALADLATVQTELTPLPAWASFDLDARVALAVTGLSLAATPLAALLPALRAARQDLRSALKDDLRTSSGLAPARLSSLLLVVQVAVSAGVLLVATSASLTASGRASRTLRVDPDRLVSTGLVFPRDEFPDEDRVRSLLAALDRRLRDLPGGLRGSVSTRRGLGPGEEVLVQLGGEPPGQGQPAFQVAVAPSYFAALDAPVLEGRGFDDRDDRQAPRVAMVDTSFARRHWPGQSVLGRRLAIVARNGRAEALQVVGLVPSLHLGGAARADAEAPGLYVPLAQLARRPGVFPLVTGPGPRAALQSALAGVIRAVDPERPPRRTWTFREDLDRQQSGLRTFVQLFGLFGLAALALSAVGLYGLIATTVRNRTREIGTRVALGATEARILALFLGRSARHLAIGLPLGGALGAGLLILTERRLGPLGAGAPAFAIVVASLLLVALAATLAPAWRAARLPPTVALRR